MIAGGIAQQATFVEVDPRKLPFTWDKALGLRYAWQGENLDAESCPESNSGDPKWGGGVFLAISRFSIANDMGEEVREAFRLRPHHVDRAQGFIRMEVANPKDNDQEFWLLTWWQSEADFHTWHHSHAYRDSHQGMPKGLKLDPAQTRMMYFQVVAQ